MNMCRHGLRRKTATLLLILFSCIVLPGVAAEAPPWRLPGLRERVRLVNAEFPTPFCDLVLEEALR